MTETTKMSFEAPAASFRVNATKRTVKGLIVPWGKIANNGWVRWRFEPGSLQWSEELSRIKLNRDHDRRQAVGVAIALTETDEGIEGEFRVARGAEGDTVLSLAEDDVLDGFSIEVEGDGFEWAADPDDELVRLVSHGKLGGVAITASPAFDDARVSGVAATKEINMPDEAKKNENAPAAPGAETKGGQAAPDFSGFAGAVESFTNAVTKLGELQAEAAERPAVVDPTQGGARLSITEESPYRFDGTRGKHDFSTDIIAGAKGDYDSMKRAQDFLSENFAINQAGTASLNPARQRPDMYVDQLEYMTPLFSSVNKGTIDDNTPFVLPKFAASSGLVGDHTEGTEPTPGALTATSQTITPSPVSGKVEVTREAWDQGGNPQLSTILWRQMVRAYEESLEQAVADHLDSLTVTEINLGVVVDAALAGDAKAALAALHFVRGGNRFRDFKLESGLYTALIDAKDGDGRPLFPVLSPSNSDGSTDAFFGALAIGGLAGIPSWALPTVAGAVPGKSYLYNREDVNAWASAPQRLDFEYRVAFVDVAIWGYKAIATTRTDGVRRVLYGV